MNREMKTLYQPPKNLSEIDLEEFQRVDSDAVPVSTIKLSARTRFRQKKEVKPKKFLLDDFKENLSKLATPKKRLVQPENRWTVSKNVLKYKATKRIESLAKPKTVSPKVSEISPQTSYQSTVSANALKYQPTPRILELARPKYYDTIVDMDEVYDYSDIDNYY